MAGILLSEAEKTFIVHGVEDDYRTDGRSRQDYRPMELETDIVSHASGSARLRLANTDILVGVKTEIDTPYPSRPNEGKIEFFVDCSANATPEFEGRGGEELGTEISNGLARAYQSSQAFDLRVLCILPRRQCWKLYVDVLILESGGNLFDAVSLAVKAALHNTRIPLVTAASMDGGQVELQLSDDPTQCQRLNIHTAPCLVTLCKIGDHCVVDPTAEEETCGTASIVVAVSGNSLVPSVFKTGVGSLHPQTLHETLMASQSIGVNLNKSLIKALEREENLRKGFRIIWRRAYPTIMDHSVKCLETQRQATTTATGAILPEPRRTTFGLVGLVFAVVPGLLIGATISKKIANFLEENDLFVPSDDDDDDD